jgi:hypothetical protein
MKETVIVCPSLLCKHPRPDIGCPRIFLPVPNLKTRQLDLDTRRGESDLLDWPSDEWNTWFGCLGCGFVSEYFSLDVQWGLLPKSAPGVYQSGEDCFCIEFLCGHRSCRTPIKFHVQETGLTESSVLEKLRSPFFFGTLACGHDNTSLPANAYAIYKVSGPIK